jgi:hypothetical protein
LFTKSADARALLFTRSAVARCFKNRNYIKLYHYRLLIYLQFYYRLWLEPYYTKESGSDESKLLQISSALATTLEMDDMEVFQGLVKLQSNALDKLKARELLSQSGYIEIKAKLDKQIQKSNPELSSVITVKADSHDRGSDLIALIAKQINCTTGGEAFQFKLVTAGTIVKPDLTLTSQNIKPGQTVMVLCMDQNSEAVQLVAEQRRILNMAKDDAETLGSSDELTIQGKHFFI